ncbi:hypothetical protein BDQ17DRAFT_1258330 [Cyathus striatus]|nr:hypothetical protein BDQ17DRAFT_1258330 [Cyathus striatus]
MSLITQMIMGHISLNMHLHHIGKADSPNCGKCSKNSLESVEHYLLQCPAYSDRHKLLLAQCAQHNWKISLRKILSAPKNLSALADFINATS